MAIVVKILNRARLERRLKNLPTQIKKDIKSDLAHTAQQIVDEMKSAVPVDTGALRTSIGWTWGRPPKGSTVIARAAQQLGSELAITIYAGNIKTMVSGEDGRFAFQLARLIEFGTRKMQAQPFFYPVWRSNKKDVRSDIRSAIKRGIKKAARQ